MGEDEGVKRPSKKKLAEARNFMRSVTDYLFAEGQKADSRDERDVVSISLRLMWAIRTEQPNPWHAACIYSFGSSLEHYQNHRNQEKWRQFHEVVDALPKPATYLVASPVIAWPDAGRAGSEVGAESTGEYRKVGDRTESANLADTASAG